MTRNTWLALIAIGTLLALAACGDDDGGTDTGNDADTTPDVEPDVPPETTDEGGTDTAADADADTPVDDAGDVEPDVPARTYCEDLVTGFNDRFYVNGEPRGFFIDLPADVETGGPWPVIFNYHGLGDTAANMRMLLSSSVNDSEFPFILVTPEDTDYMFGGLMPIDWDVAVVTTENREALMFDEILDCIATRWGLDANHVHAVGFSMGGFVVDMLGTIRGDVVASLLTYSGGYGSNPDNLTGYVGTMVDWPEFSSTNKYAQVLLHGGTTDYRSFVVDEMHFDVFAANDAAFLNGHGHDVVLCDHGGGHTAPPTFMSPQILRFFADHPLGTDPSPYATDGLPASFPSYCTLSGGI